MASMTVTRRIVVSTVVLPAASAVFGVMILASSPPSSAAPGIDVSGSSATPTTAADMPGMDMGGGTPTPTPTMAADMPGMDMGGGTPTPTPTMAADMPGMDMGGISGGAAVHRPLAPVLGTFGGGTVAVLLTAGMLRRKDQAADLVKKAARISGRAKG